MDTEDIHYRSLDKKQQWVVNGCSIEARVISERIVTSVVSGLDMSNEVKGESRLASLAQLMTLVLREWKQWS